MNLETDHRVKKYAIFSIFLVLGYEEDYEPEP